MARKIKKFDIEPLNAYEDNKAIIIVPNLELSKSKIVNFTYAQDKLSRKDNNKKEIS